MKENVYRLLGVMSGTSLDGIDLALVTISFEKPLKYELLKSETVAYSSYWQMKLRQASCLQSPELVQLDQEYTVYLGEVIQRFIEQNEIANLDAVCSHGHTVKHLPNQGITFQIGNLPKLAKIVKNRVICDFRVQDVELGGQGAPLVPLGDRLLFSEYDFCLNMGGFANISFEGKQDRVAYDICALNTVFNHYMEKLGKHFDKNGEVARSGELNQNLLDNLNSLEFYKLPYPKSLGIEWVQTEIFPLIDSLEENVPDILHTYALHASEQIANSLDDKRESKVLVTGGGAYNTFLMEQLKRKTTCTITIPRDEIIEYKEALIFALLGVLKLRGEINVLHSVTGAKMDHSSGRIFEF